jgi:hypothetical protein
MQQEQWERDGAYASVYDRELRPLKVPSDPNLDKEKGKTGETDEPEWPLKSPALQPKLPVGKPKSDAGYRTVPTVNGASGSNTVPKIQQMQLQPNDVEGGRDKKKKKSLCCCVIC